MEKTPHDISLKGLVKRFWKKASVTWGLVLCEGIAILIIPLAIGWAVDDLMAGSTRGIIKLGGLCILLLFFGAARRFYDTRVYAGIYRKVSNELVSREKQRDASISKISARATLFTEFIEFLENSLPDIFNQIVGFVGTLGIIAVMDMKVFWGCLTGAAVTVIIYAVSQKKLIALNQGQNDEYEKQVDCIASPAPECACTHFRNLMNWNIRLSDLETINFSLTWIALVAVLLFAVITVAGSGNTTFGQMVSLIMYVFGFMESVMHFPLYYQQIVRLGEIAGRLG